ncbi:N-acetyltransferase [Rhizocola hellebori]|uniref:N-acetyltransferase n=2 Tax=Rhizocola hellebori TaxID=1392758 RepID=A0A8J3VK77_9ACTN|nr:N-acetyltransferase [Rhizocola hellebori]
MARSGDLELIVSLAAARRAEYEVHQPQFWRVAPRAKELHHAHLASLIVDDQWGSFVSEPFTGYVFARLVPAPPVYDPGGPSCFVDDFAVTSARLWLTDGKALLDAAARWGAARGAAQLVVVNGQHDALQAELLAAYGLSIASTWSAGSLPQIPAQH